jgi:hypothetical protein
MYIGSLHANALKLVKATFDVLAELLCDAEAWRIGPTIYEPSWLLLWGSSQLSN